MCMYLVKLHGIEMSLSSHSPLILTDTTGHYTPTFCWNWSINSVTDNVAKINGYQTGQSLGTNSHLKVTGAQLGIN